MKVLLLTWLSCIAVISAGPLKFEKDTLEVNADLNSKTVESEYHFTNTSNKLVTIKSADAGCSCLAVKVAGGKMSYKPGESGVLKTVFEVGVFQGLVDKPIYIWLDDAPEEKPSVTLHLRVQVPVIITLEPRTLKWKVGDKPKPKRMDIKMDYKKPIRIKKVSTSQDKSFKLKVITVEAGKHYQIEVTPLTIGSPTLGIIRVETDVDVKKQRVQQGFATVSRK